MKYAELRLKALVDCPIVKSDGDRRLFIGMENIESGSGELLDGVDQVSGSDGVRHLPGDVLFGKLRPYLAKSFFPTAPGNGSAEFLVLRSRGELHPRFLFYVTLSAPWLEWAVVTSYGTRMPRTSWEAMAEYRVSFPSLEEQRRVVSFLDGEIARIDKAIKLRARQCKLLSRAQWSKFEAVLDECHTSPLPLRRVLESIVDGPFGSAFSSSDYSDNGAAVVRLGNIGFAEYRSEPQARIPLALADRFCQHKVVEGDLLIAGLGDSRNHAGRACVAPSLGPAIVKGKCFRARVRQAKASANFLALLLSSPYGADAFESRGSTRSMINLELVKSAVLPFPSYGDQLAVVAEMRHYRRSLSSVLALCERQITVLAERRHALITAAVTGQIDVSTARGVIA